MRRTPHRTCTPRPTPSVSTWPPARSVSGDHHCWGSGRSVPPRLPTPPRTRFSVRSTGSWQRTRPARPVTERPAGRGEPPVFFCSKAVALRGRHAFFRIGGAAAGNHTIELEHDERGDHCPCGIQGLPERDYPEDRDSTEARCVPAPSIRASCLERNWSSYPVGKYCALGPNSNTYAGVLSRWCGGGTLEPPGWLPGFDDAPPVAGTANPMADARTTFLPGAGCLTIDCRSEFCKWSPW